MFIQREKKNPCLVPFCNSSFQSFFLFFFSFLFCKRFGQSQFFSVWFDFFFFCRKVFVNLLVAMVSIYVWLSPCHLIPQVFFSAHPQVLCVCPEYPQNVLPWKSLYFVCPQVVLFVHNVLVNFLEFYIFPLARLSPCPQIPILSQCSLDFCLLSAVCFPHYPYTCSLFFFLSTQVFCHVFCKFYFRSYFTALFLFVLCRSVVYFQLHVSLQVCIFSDRL